MGDHDAAPPERRGPVVPGMKVPLFTLVHDPSAGRRSETRFAPMTAGDLNPNLLNTILSSVKKGGKHGRNS